MFLWLFLTWQSFATALSGGLLNQCEQVTGVYFESKVDYTTWFGDNVEYIHGIQVRICTGQILLARFFFS